MKKYDCRLRRSNWYVVLAGIIMCVILVGCGSAKKKDSDSEVTEISSEKPLSLKGEYPNLKSIEMAEDKDGNRPVLTLYADADYSSLEKIDCGSVILKGEFEDSFEEIFPSLESVSFHVTNEEAAGEDFLKMGLFYVKYQEGVLDDFDVEVFHTIEDLYGEWKDKQGILSFTIKKDGKIRIGDGAGFIGADVLNYSEVDDNTLSLQTDSLGKMDLLSFNMEYEILGDTLYVTLLGQDFEMVR